MYGLVAHGQFVVAFSRKISSVWQRPTLDVALTYVEEFHDYAS
jgi:hypothetical protein